MTRWPDLIPEDNDLHIRVAAFLQAFGRADTLAHVEAVAQAARQLAGHDSQHLARLAEQAGWLHDISAVIPTEQRLGAAHQWAMPVLPEEEAFPMLLHQGLSAVMARRWFGIQDEGVLSAIGCHTTLRPGASRLDKIVFIADKLAWDQPGTPPYLPGLRSGLEISLDTAALLYLDDLEKRLSRPLHPWAAAALAELRRA
jgi:predicted HD superfamily hydrolase involved in NAD metabolism